MEETSENVAAEQSVMLTCLHGVNASAEVDWCREAGSFMAYGDI